MLYSNAPIGIIDSGVGGLTVLRELWNILPYEQYIYWGDTAHTPYGNKAKHIVLEYLSEGIEFLLGKSIKCIVIACNTASGSIFQAIQKRYPTTQFINMIDNGLNLLQESSDINTITILATQSTVEEGYYATIVKERFPGSTVQAIACPQLVLFAEQGILEGKEVDDYIETLTHNIEHSTKCIILACTHFPLFEASFIKIFPSGIHIYNPAFSVAESVYNLCKEIGIHEGTKRLPVQHYTTGDDTILTTLVKNVL